RLPPQEGLDVAQLGTIYHEILEYLYRSLSAEARRDVAALLDALPGIAKRVLDAAPRQQGFRETAWWQETRREIVRVVERTVRALAQLPGDYEPVAFEARFTRRRPLRIRDGDDQFYLRGVVDRIDRDPAGRLRVIDYKTAGPWSYSARSLEEGKRLQLPLYALAARDALRLGQPADGFYWHIRQAESSGLRLADYGLEAALTLATDFAWAAVRGARAGEFRPTPPDGGCPEYCPAATFCWQYQPGRWG
ncbi:MAG: PD-(D/E)XK nuclease family protein, partial [Candidatus Promineifilaceae bacterium]|nr:PD-(D/E)XK nuclease family protein [Candidatus Promineifilaceae bacterium]